MHQIEKKKDTQSRSRESVNLHFKNRS